MFKLWASIRKELFLLLSDKTGLALLFVMPLILVFAITIIQDSAYKVFNENKIELLVVNHDRGEMGEKLYGLMENSGLFTLDSGHHYHQNEVGEALLNGNQLAAIYIPANFSSDLGNRAGVVTQIIRNDLGMGTKLSENKRDDSLAITLYHDPILQQNFVYSIMGILQSYLSIIENNLMIDRLYADMELEVTTEKLKKQITSNPVSITQEVATKSGKAAIPNSTQHNVPAWTLFAMFFMVVSLGSNVVKERVNGSFLRLKTMPSSFSLVMSSKMMVYVAVAILQVILIFSLAEGIMPKLGLPELSFPQSWLPMIVIVFLSAMAAVSYALMIGTLAKTQEQANGFGAVSVVLFGAIGGIWVPTFVMPEYMQMISMVSPLHWCLQGYYVLFLNNGSWHELTGIITYIALFVIISQLVTYLKLRLDKII